MNFFWHPNPTLKSNFLSVRRHASQPGYLEHFSVLVVLLLAEPVKKQHNKLFSLFNKTGLIKFIHNQLNNTKLKWHGMTKCMAFAWQNNRDSTRSRSKLNTGSVTFGGPFKKFIITHIYNSLKRYLMTVTVDILFFLIFNKFNKFNLLK